MAARRDYASTHPADCTCQQCGQRSGNTNGFYSYPSVPAGTQSISVRPSASDDSMPMKPIRTRSDPTGGQNISSSSADPLMAHSNSTLDGTMAAATDVEAHVLRKSKRRRCCGVPRPLFLVCCGILLAAIGIGVCSYVIMDGREWSDVLPTKQAGRTDANHMDRIVNPSNDAVGSDSPVTTASRGTGREPKSIAQPAGGNLIETPVVDSNCTDANCTDTNCAVYAHDSMGCQLCECACVETCVNDEVCHHGKCVDLYTMSASANETASPSGDERPVTLLDKTALPTAAVNTSSPPPLSTTNATVDPVTQLPNVPDPDEENSTTTSSTIASTLVTSAVPVNATDAVNMSEAASTTTTTDATTTTVAETVPIQSVTLSPTEPSSQASTAAPPVNPDSAIEALTSTVIQSSTTSTSKPATTTQYHDGYLSLEDVQGTAAAASTPVPGDEEQPLPVATSEEQVDVQTLSESDMPQLASQEATTTTTTTVDSSISVTPAAVVPTDSQTGDAETISTSLLAPDVQSSPSTTASSTTPATINSSTTITPAATVQPEIEHPAADDGADSDETSAATATGDLSEAPKEQGDAAATTSPVAVETPAGESAVTEEPVSSTTPPAPASTTIDVAKL